MTTVATPVAKTRNPVVLFVLDTAERAMKTAAQTATAALGGEALNVWHFPWHDSVGLVAGSALLSILTSLASVSVGDKTSASIVR